MEIWRSTQLSFLSEPAITSRFLCLMLIKMYWNLALRTQTFLAKRTRFRAKSEQMFSFSLHLYWKKRKKLQKWHHLGLRCSFDVFKLKHLLKRKVKIYVISILTYVYLQKVLSYMTRSIEFQILSICTLAYMCVTLMLSFNLMYLMSLNRF